jgi:hypothetical protein
MVGSAGGLGRPDPGAGRDPNREKKRFRAGTDKILGATIVARHTGEMISKVTTAMVAGMGLGTLAAVIHPYPTQAEASRRAGDLDNRSRLTPWLKRLLAGYLRWRR